MIRKGDADTFYQQIKALHTFLKQEWVEIGNLAEDFQELGSKILIVLDNASFHKKKIY